MGSGEFDSKAIADLIAKTALPELNTGYHNIIKDMDRLAAIVFER
jgi:hypothetical protein